MTEESDAQFPHEVDAFLERLLKALPESDTITQQQVLEALAIFVGSILETMVDQSGQTVDVRLLLVEFMQRLGVACGGHVVGVTRVELDDEPPGKLH